MKCSALVLQYQLFVICFTAIEANQAACLRWIRCKTKYKQQISLKCITDDTSTQFFSMVRWFYCVTQRGESDQQLLCSLNLTCYSILRSATIVPAEMCVYRTNITLFEIINFMSSCRVQYQIQCKLSCWLFCDGCFICKVYTVFCVTSNMII